MSEKNRTKYIVLGMLAIKPCSGYDINKMIQSSTSYFWSESEGQIYPALAKCVAEDLATCREEHAPNNERIRKIYAITAKGKKILNEWLKRPAQKALMRSEFLLKIFFAGNISVKDAIVHINNFQKESQKELLILENTQTQLLAKDDNNAKFWLLSVEFGIKTTKAELSWCKNTLDTLNNF